MDIPFHLTVQVKPVSSACLQSTLVWLFKSSQSTQHVFSQHWYDCSSQASQLGTSSVNTGLIVQVKPASSARLQSTLVWLFKSSQPPQHVFSQHWFDCSSHTSQLGTSSINTSLIVQVKSASSARLHLIPCVLYGRSMCLDSTRLVRMSCTLVHARPYRKQTINETLDHKLMGFEWSEKGPLDQHFNDYKRGHLDGWWDRL